MKVRCDWLYCPVDPTPRPPDVPVAALVGQDQLAAAGKVVALMVAGILVGLFCVLVGLTLGLWIAYYYWRENWPLGVRPSLQEG